MPQGPDSSYSCVISPCRISRLFEEASPGDTPQPVLPEEIDTAGPIPRARGWWILFTRLQGNCKLFVYIRGLSPPPLKQVAQLPSGPGASRVEEPVELSRLNLKSLCRIIQILRLLKVGLLGFPAARRLLRYIHPSRKCLCKSVCKERSEHMRGVEEHSLSSADRLSG